MRYTYNWLCCFYLYFLCSTCTLLTAIFLISCSSCEVEYTSPRYYMRSKNCSLYSRWIIICSSSARDVDTLFFVNDCYLTLFMQSFFRVVCVCYSIRKTYSKTTLNVINIYNREVKNNFTYQKVAKTRNFI